MKGAGALRHRLAFESRSTQADGYGNTLDAWTERFVRPAALDFERGNETVMAARLEGRAIVRARVWADPDTLTVTPDFRVRQVETGTIYAVRDVDKVTDPKWVWMRIEAGVAA